MRGMYNWRFEVATKCIQFHTKNNIFEQKIPKNVRIESRFHQTKAKKNKSYTQKINEIEIEKKNRELLFFARCSPVISALSVRFNHLCLADG